MVLLCFVLDLPNLSPPLLADLKQSLLQLANFYAVSSCYSRSEEWPSKSLGDRIGLCYLIFNRSSGSNELKIAYNPRGNFSLRDFHQAVHNLPTDGFSPQFYRSEAPCCHDVKLLTVLSDEVIYSWGGKDIMRKVIFLSSCLVENINCELRKALMDAADKCITVEFVLLEQNSSYLGGFTDGINNFLKHICDLENCSFQSCLPDVQLFSMLVKRWLLELKEDMEEPLQAHFVFKSSLVGSSNQMSCSLSRSAYHIVDGFSSCKACRCHGILLDDVVNKKNYSSSCPVTGQDLATSDLMENSVKVGKQTILFLSSFQSCMKLQQVSSSIDFDIIERINLGSVSEGVISGTSHFVTPAACQELEVSLDELDKLEFNAQLFKGLCSVLHSLDQGLVCSSNCDIQTMRVGPLQCYYILQPSDGGPMLLRRLAGSEEFLPIPHINRINDSSVSREIEGSIQASLLAMELRDYNPILHERGFHRMMNELVKQSLHFGSMPPLEETKPESNPTESDPPEASLHSQSVTDIIEQEEEEIAELNLKTKEDRTAAQVTEEWEQLIVNEIPKMHSPDCISKPKSEKSVLSSVDSCRQADMKTSRILERLEIPRQLKSKLASPVLGSTIMTDAGTPTKSPVILTQSTPVVAHGSTLSQPMKPIFQRSKRKQR